MLVFSAPVSRLKSVAEVTRYGCYTLFPTFKALRESEDTAASVLGDFFCYFFSSPEKK